MRSAKPGNHLKIYGPLLCQKKRCFAADNYITSSLYLSLVLVFAWYMIKTYCLHSKRPPLCNKFQYFGKINWNQFLNWIKPIVSNNLEWEEFVFIIKGDFISSLWTQMYFQSSLLSNRGPEICPHSQAILDHSNSPNFLCHLRLRHRVHSLITRSSRLSKKSYVWFSMVQFDIALCSLKLVRSTCGKSSDLRERSVGVRERKASPFFWSFYIARRHGWVRQIALLSLLTRSGNPQSTQQGSRKS